MALEPNVSHPRREVPVRAAIDLGKAKVSKLETACSTQGTHAVVEVLQLCWPSVD